MKWQMRLEGNRAFAFDPAPMGLLSRFQSKATTPDTSTAAPRTGFPPGSWRRASFAAYPIGGDMHAIHRQGQLPLQLPSFVVDFALSCESFKPFQTHLQQHASLHGWNSLQRESIHQWIPEMIAAGMVTSEVTITRRCAESVGTSLPGQIDLVGFPTGGNRVPILSRAVRSFVENARAYGRKPEFLVSDGSMDPGQQASFRSEAASISREFGAIVSYSGIVEKQRYAKELVRRSGCPPSVVEFALFDPLKVGFTCGANRNAILLHGAGRLICSIDDDVVCRLAHSPERSDKLALFSTCDPFSRFLYADPEAVLKAARLADLDFLAEHERLLGRDLASISSQNGAERRLDLEHAREDILHRIEKESTSVRATFAGHFGDPGIPTSAYFLYYEGENRERLTASIEHYESVFGSRSVFTCAPHDSVGDGSVSPGMAMGLDQRELLPPFFPVLHAEDFIYGATVWHCCPGALLGHLPVAVQHEPLVRKPILQPRELGGDCRAVIFEFAHLIRQMTRHHIAPEHASAAERMQRLGRAFTERAAIPPSDFIESMRGDILHHESEKMIFLQTQLEGGDDLPDYWRQDVEQYLAHVRESLGAPDFDIPFDLKSGRSDEANRALMQELIANYGALLEAWPALFEAARELREEGTVITATAQ